MILNSPSILIILSDVMNLCPNLSPELWISSSDCQLDISILINSEQLKLHIGKRKFLIVPSAQPEAVPPAIFPSSVNDKFTFHLAQVRTLHTILHTSFQCLISKLVHKSYQTAFREIQNLITSPYLPNGLCPNHRCLICVN